MTASVTTAVDAVVQDVTLAAARPSVDRDSTRVRVRRRPAAWVIGSGLAALAAAAILSARVADADSGRDLLTLGRVVGLDMAHLRWQYVTIVLAFGALHYVATAVAARAAAGLSLPLGQTILVQLSAAAANRLTPAGLGGSAVTARYFSRRGMSAPSVVGSVVALSVLGGAADLMVLTLLVFAGGWIGLGGAHHELALLMSRLAGAVAPMRSPWTWLALGAIVAVGLAVSRRLRADRPGLGQRLRAPVIGLARQPRRLATLMSASGTTTLLLAFAFVASTAMVPGPHPQASAGALLLGYMLGAAAGNAIPTPAGVGSTETALTAVLVAAAVPLAHAVEVVLVFRLITFWLPAAAGILATRSLRRAGAI